MLGKLDNDAAKQVDHYVYLYVDPRDGKIFYVGMGQKNRALEHLSDTKECRKTQRIKEIRDLNLEPLVEILQSHLNREQALRLESAAIDLIGLANLTNDIRGHSFEGFRRDSWEAVYTELTAEPREVTERVILMNIRNSFRPGMSPQELYDATRSAWRVKNLQPGEGPDYAFAMAGSIVREVYKITGWFPAGSTMPDKVMSPKDEGRLEFVGHIAKEMSARYTGKKVAGLSSKSQNPIRYLNCDVDDDTPEDREIQIEE